MEDRRIPAGSLSASTYYNSNLAPWLGRVNSIRSWSTRVNNRRQWLQINLDNVARITGIATQGRRDANQWVTRYILSFGDSTFFKVYREKGRTKVRLNLSPFTSSYSETRKGLRNLSGPASVRITITRCHICS